MFEFECSASIEEVVDIPDVAVKLVNRDRKPVVVGIQRGEFSVERGDVVRVVVQVREIARVNMLIEIDPDVSAAGARGGSVDLVCLLFEFECVSVLASLADVVEVFRGLEIVGAFKRSDLALRVVDRVLGFSRED